MNDKDYRKVQDEIFQQIRDLEVIAKRRDKESDARATRIMQTLEEMAQARGIPVRDFFQQIVDGHPDGNAIWDIKIIDGKERRITLRQWLQTIHTLRKVQDD